MPAPAARKYPVIAEAFLAKNGGRLLGQDIDPAQNDHSAPGFPTTDAWQAANAGGIRSAHRQLDLVKEMLGLRPGEVS
jgi:hypothetical protein